MDGLSSKFQEILYLLTEIILTLKGGVADFEVNLRIHNPQKKIPAAVTG